MITQSDRKEIMETLGRNIKEIRLKRGFTQGEVALQLGHKSPAYLAFIEQGKRNITAVDLITLTYVLRTSLKELSKK